MQHLADKTDTRKLYGTRFVFMLKRTMKNDFKMLHKNQRPVGGCEKGWSLVVVLTRAI